MFCQLEQTLMREILSNFQKFSFRKINLKNVISKMKTICLKPASKPLDTICVTQSQSVKFFIYVSTCQTLVGLSPLHCHSYRVLHMLDVPTDNCLTGHFRLVGPIEITWRDSVDMPSIPIHCKCMGGWFVLKSIAHGSKCPIELCLHIDVSQKFNWLMKTCSKFPPHLQDAAN